MATVNEIFGFGPESVFYIDSHTSDETTGQDVALILSNLPTTIRDNLPYSAQRNLSETLYRNGIVDSSASWSVESEATCLWVSGGYRVGKESVPIRQIKFVTSIVKKDAGGNIVGDMKYCIVLTGKDLLKEINKTLDDTPGAQEGQWQSWKQQGYGDAECGTFEDAVLRLEKEAAQNRKNI